MQTQRGTGYFLEIDLVTPITEERGNEADYKLVACTTSDSFDLSNASETTSNKCSNGNQESQPGEQSWTMTSDGQVVTLDPAETTTRENNQTLKRLAKEKTVFWARRTNAVNEEVGYAEGLVWISSYNDAAPNNDVFTFNVTLQGTGEIFIEPATT